MEEQRTLMSAKAVSETLNISVSYAYKIIGSLNEELSSKGYLTIPGKVDSLYFARRFFPEPDKI